MIKVVVELNDDEALALAQMYKRAHLERLTPFANMSDGGRERNLTMDGLNQLQWALREVGHDPR
jgi:hypothetical protein